MTDLHAFDDIAAALAGIEDWEDRYRYVLDLGRRLQPLDDAHRTPAALVRGCSAQVWLVVTDEMGLLLCKGDSDAMIMRGLVAILVALCSGRPAEEVANMDVVAAFDALHLREHLTPQRSNGLAAMAARIRDAAELAIRPA